MASIRTSVARRPGARAVSLAALLVGCSLTDLDYLGAERGQPEVAGSGGSGNTAGAGGRAPTRGGVDAGAAAGTAPETGNGGTDSAGRSASAGAGNDTGPAGSSSSAGEGGMPAQDPGQAGQAGEPQANAGIVYGVVGQSCKGGLSCGAGVDCCEGREVPGGSFQMGDNANINAQPDEKPPHLTTVSAFTLDTFEVSVSRFRRFVEAYDGTLPSSGAGAHPQIESSGWRVDYDAEMPASRAALESQISCDVGNYQTWTTQSGAKEGWPMNCVSWYLAFAFCIWDGARLPTEAEWEAAAAGLSEERTFPWGGATPDFATNVVANCKADGEAACSPADLLMVGSRAAGAGRFGHLDLSGSLWEWTLDHYDATYYQSVGTCSNCANLASATPRALRGGSFTSLGAALRASARASKPPRTSDPYTGFRCARSP